MPAVAEKHYRVKELAALWALSKSTISRLFRDEEGVKRIGHGRGSRRKRPYITLSIPESVAARVAAKLSQPVKASDLHFRAPSKRAWSCRRSALDGSALHRP